MLTVGVDIVEIPRIAEAVTRWGDRFLHRIYTQQERNYCGSRIDRFATRFAAKEAVMKALGTGIRGIAWREIEVVRQRGRPPQVHLHGRALARAQALGLTELAVSLSHSHEYAVASVVGTTQ